MKPVLKHIFLFLIPKLTGNLYYFVSSAILILLFTGMIFMGVLEMTYANAAMWRYLGIAVGVAVVFVFNIILLERVEFLHKVMAFDASLGIEHSSKRDVKKVSMSKQELFGNWIYYSLIMLLVTFIIIVVFLYIFSVIMVDGDFIGFLREFIPVNEATVEEGELYE